MPAESTNIRPKTIDRLQAQIELYADRNVPDFSDEQSWILQYSAELAKITDLENLPPDFPPELQDFISKHKDSYLRFLREERKTEISFAERNSQNYRDNFKDPVHLLKEQMNSGDPSSIPGYLGAGSNGFALRLDVHGKAYAAKFSREITQSNFEIRPLLRAKGIPHLAQIEAYSFQDGVIITELLPGNNISEYPPEHEVIILDDHIIQLIETVIELDSHGLVIDPKPSNFLYDPEKGFSILDYHLKSGESRYNLPQEIMSLRIALTTRKFEQLSFRDPHYKEKAHSQSVERYKIYLPMMIRFLGILKENYPNILNEWKSQQERDKQDPFVRVGDIIDREYIPDDPVLNTYLDQLTQLGF